MIKGINVPYVKEYNDKGFLTNPILFNYESVGPNRKERRGADGISSTRPFSNKKGIQINIVQVGRYSFMKFEKKVIQQGDTGTRVQFVERKLTK